MQGKMIPFVCNRCGRDLQVPDQATVVTCPACHAYLTTPYSKNLEKLASIGKRIKRADKLRAELEFERAHSSYREILAEFPDVAEAYWGLLLCRYGIVYVDDPNSEEKVPTCMEISAESFLEDRDYRNVLENAPDENARKVYEEQAAKIEKVRKKVYQVHYETQDPYDVFISYKKEDVNLLTGLRENTVDQGCALQIYDALREHNYRVFFAEVELSKKAVDDYEAYIFNAMRTAKIMLVVGTRKEYLESKWVKNEWNRYLKMIRKDENSQSAQKRVLQPVYKGMNPADFPREWGNRQAVNLDNGNALDQILSIVADATGRDKPATGRIRKQGGTSLDNRLEMAEMDLRSGGFAEAANIYNEILNNYDSQCAEASLGLVCCDWKCRYITSVSLKNAILAEAEHPQPREYDMSGEKQDVSGYVVQGYFEESEVLNLLPVLEPYQGILAPLQDEFAKVETYFRQNEQWLHFLQTADPDVKHEYKVMQEQVLGSLRKTIEAAKEKESYEYEIFRADFRRQYDSAVEIIKEKSEKATEQREHDYQRYCHLSEESEIPEAIRFFERVGAYKDSRKKIDLLKNLQKEIKKIGDPQYYLGRLYNREQPDETEACIEQIKVSESKSKGKVIALGYYILTVIVSAFVWPIYAGTSDNLLSLYMGGGFFVSIALLLLFWELEMPITALVEVPIVLTIASALGTLASGYTLLSAISNGIQILVALAILLALCLRKKRLLRNMVDKKHAKKKAEKFLRRCRKFERQKRDELNTQWKTAMGTDCTLPMKSIEETFYEVARTENSALLNDDGNADSQHGQENRRTAANGKTSDNRTVKLVVKGAGPDQFKAVQVFHDILGWDLNKSMDALSKLPFEITLKSDVAESVYDGLVNAGASAEIKNV